MSNAGTNDRFQTQYIIRWWFCAMAITPPAPPQQQQQQQQQQENNSKKTNKNTTATATAATTTTTTRKKTTTAATTTRKRFFAEQIRRHVDAVLPTASCRKFRRLIPSHGSLRLSSLRCYYDATVSLENFRRRLFPAKVRSNLKPSTLLQCYGFAQELPSTRSEAEVRSGLEAVDATTIMLRFRSGTSVDAVPKQRFARAWRPSTLLRWWGFARELPSTRFRSKGSLRPASRRR